MLIKRSETDADVPVGKHEQTTTLTLEQAESEILAQTHPAINEVEAKALIALQLRRGETIRAGHYEYHAPPLAAWIPANSNEAKMRLRAINLQSNDAEFLLGWLALAFLHPGFHPDNDPADHPRLYKAIISEGWDRYVNGQLSDEEFYCAEATRAGIKNSNKHPTLAEIEAAPTLRPTPKPETQVDGFDI